MIPRGGRMGGGPIAPVLLAGALGLAVWGCASPGQPRPPSLKLPRVADDVSLERVGDAVELHWTTPALTTDGLPVPPKISAAICRVEVFTVHGSCVEVSRSPTQPGPAAFRDVLPSGLSAGPPRLIAYRVEILNGAGRSAGRSAEAFAAGGTAPIAVGDLVANAARDGVRLHWTPGPADAGVELDRIDVSQTLTASASKPRKVSLPGTEKPGPEVHLSGRAAGEPDAGGALDQTAKKGVTYRYTAQRVQMVAIGGHALTLRSLPSGAVSVKVLDTFPPRPPAGLEAAAGAGDPPAIDLSWQPGIESDLAGYNVYRTESLGGTSRETWQRVNTALVPVPGFSDGAVRAGTAYRYRVTSVDAEGNESAPGNEVQQTPATR